MHPWIVFLHVLGVFGFLVAHGASVNAAFALRREHNLERVRALLELSTNSYSLMYPSLVVLLVAGVVAGFTGNWWGQGWIWVALGLLIVITVAMYAMGSSSYSAVRKLAGLPYVEAGKPQAPQAPGSAQEIDAALAQTKPILLAGIGFGGIAIIAWLMILKPF